MPLSLKRGTPWIITAIALVAFGASFSELQRLRGRFGEVSHHQFHDHKDVRSFMIKTELAGAAAEHPIVVIGDSIVEMARLPDKIEDVPVINAGVGGASILDFKFLAPQLLAPAVRPRVIAVALGTNNSGPVERDYDDLLSSLKKLTPRVLAIATLRDKDTNLQIKTAAKKQDVQFIEISISDNLFLPDRVHLTAEGARTWANALVAAIGAP